MDGDVVEHEIRGYPRIAVHICDDEGVGAEVWLELNKIGVWWCD